MPVNVEIERRFILRNIPLKAERSGTVLGIGKFYKESDAGVIRYRCTSANGKPDQYEKIIKLSISPGVNTEEILPVTKESFEQELSDNMRYISKKRFVVNEGKHKFEFDVFKNMKLVILEVEVNDLHEEIVFPDWIKREIIAEITGMKEFSNYNMARVE